MFKKNFVAVVKCKGKILREYSDGIVRLPFGSEYSIYLKNEETRPALVSIDVDGENVLKGHKLILDGGTSTEIKGFMRDMKETNRFKFIKKTKEISDYRGDRIEDGLIKITFQFEEEVPTPVITCGPTWSDVYYLNNPIIGGGLRGTAGSSTKFGNSITEGSNEPNITCNFCCTDNGMLNNKVDDGITVKGTKVNQAYSYGNIGTLESTRNVIVLKLEGETKVKKKAVAKPVTVKTVLRCETCGRKNKPLNNFCYNCGTYLD